MLNALIPALRFITTWQPRGKERAVNAHSCWSKCVPSSRVPDSSRDTVWPRAGHRLALPDRDPQARLACSRSLAATSRYQDWTLGPGRCCHGTCFRCTDSRAIVKGVGWDRRGRYQRRFRAVDRQLELCGSSAAVWTACLGNAGRAIWFSTTSSWKRQTLLGPESWLNRAPIRQATQTSY